MRLVLDLLLRFERKTKITENHFKELYVYKYFSKNNNLIRFIKICVGINAKQTPRISNYKDGK